MSTTPRQIIIFEGPDGAGKSVAAAAVAAALGVNVTHHGPFTGETQIGAHYLDSMAPALNNAQHVVMDRAWFSEPIYGTVFRGGTNRITRVHERMLQRCAIARNALVVLCLPPLETCLSNYRSRKAQEYLDNGAQLREVWHAYNMFTPSAGVDLLRFDYTKTPTALLSRDIRRLLTRQQFNNGPGIGAWRKSGLVTLLVGERMGEQIFDGRKTDAEVPFVSFNRAGCADWLTQQLESAGIPETALYWVNARNAAGVLTKPEFIRELQPARIIALGEEAHKWCEHHAHIRHITVPHPQYWKRFCSKEPYPLLKELTE